MMICTIYFYKGGERPRGMIFAYRSRERVGVWGELMRMMRLAGSRCELDGDTVTGQAARTAPCQCTLLLLSSSTHTPNRLPMESKLCAQCFYLIRICSPKAMLGCEDSCARRTTARFGISSQGLPSRAIKVTYAHQKRKKGECFES